MANGFNTTQEVPSQRDEGWWSKVSSALQENPMLSKDTDYGMLGSVLGRGSQVFSAKDPTSWQHQLGGLGAQIGQAHKLSLIQEKERKRKDIFSKMLLKALGLDASMLGGTEEVSEEGAEEDIFGIGKLNKPSALLDMGMGGIR